VKKEDALLANETKSKEALKKSFAKDMDQYTVEVKKNK